MSKLVSSLVDQFAAQSRIVQWGVIAGLFIMAFLAWDSYVRPIADNMRADADATQRNVERLSAAGLADQFRSISPAVLAMGDVEMPGSAEDESEKLVDAVLSIYGEFGTNRILKFKLDRRTSVRLRKETLSGVAQGRQLDKVIADIEFEATTTDAIAFIRELESNPEIESLANLRLTKTGSRNGVQVRLAAEAWGFTSGRG